MIVLIMVLSYFDQQTLLFDECS